MLIGASLSSYDVVKCKNQSHLIPDFDECFWKLNFALKRKTQHTASKNYYIIFLCL